MRANLIVGLTPTLHEPLHLPECINQLPIKQLIASRPVETLASPVLPRTPGRDKQCLNTHSLQPVAYSFRRNLWPVIRPNVRGDSPLHKEFRQAIAHIIGAQPSLDIAGPTFPRVFIDTREQLHRSPILGACRHTIRGPDRIGILGPEPDARPIGQPEPPPRRLFLWHLQAFASPDPFHPLVIDPPTRISEETRHLPLSIARPYWLAS